MWLVAGNSEKRKNFIQYVEPRDLLLIPQSIFIFSCTLFCHNTLAGLCISSTPHAFILRSLVIVSHTLHFSNNSHI